MWEDNVARFNEIDSKYGDGDHGVTIGKIVAAIRHAVAEGAGQPVKAFLADLGGAVMAVGGGSAGPLYGTLFEGLGDGLDAAATTVGPAEVRAMLGSCQAAMAAITKARVGDKTMMDALIPAVAAGESAVGDIPEVLQAAAQAAADGAQATAQMVSKFGRARSYGDQTLGTPDAGALSTALLFQGLAAGLD
ncbi:MAG: DAK2 domain-containing protein [Propionibacteriaceae bacterium]|jgi:dihydroxyacetone kinase-like protein|nr:DAK2 domain-containing protein [Propionibacteriaceae bacterium]